MRVKAHWFRDESAKAPEEVAGAVAFIAFRVAHNTLKSMRKAQFDIALRNTCLRNALLAALVQDHVNEGEHHKYKEET